MVATCVIHPVHPQPRERVFDPPLRPCWSLHAIETARRHLTATWRNGNDHPIQARERDQAPGVLGVAPELRLTANGNSVATLIVYTNYTSRNEDGSTRQESEWHRVIVWSMHAEKVARLPRKCTKIRVQGRMTYPTWNDKQTGATRYGAEIIAEMLDY